MTIFLDATTVCNEQSGTGVYTKTLLDFLQKRLGNELKVIGDPGILGTVLKPLRKNGASASIQPFSGNPHWALLYQLYGNRNRTPAHAAFFPNYFMPPNWPCPSAVTIHDVSFLSHPRLYSVKMRTWYTRRIRHTTENARLILTVSEASRDAIRTFLGVKPERILVHSPIWLPNPAVHGKVRKKMPHERPYLLYIGNMEPKKNLFHLVEGFLQAELDGLDLVLIGKAHASRSWTSRFHRLIKNSKQVYYKRYLNDEQLDLYLHHSRGYVNVSYIEGFGISLLKALSEGIPSLISNDPALMEVSDGRSQVVNPHHPESIARGLQMLASANRQTNSEKTASIHHRYSFEQYEKSISAALERLEQFQFPVLPVSISPRSALSEAIISEIAYAAVFSSGISKEALLWSIPVKVKDKRIFFQAIDKLLKDYPELVRLTGRTLTAMMIRPEPKISDNGDLPKQHQKLLRLIGACPWIRVLYFSGGTVHRSSLEEHTDLDVCIISSTDRVWIAFLWTRLAAFITGKRKSFCSNYFMDYHAQEVFWQQDHYTAHQILFLRQVFRKKKIQHLRAYNSWIYRYFPNAPRCSSSRLPEYSSRKNLLYWLNLLIMTLCSIRWKNKGILSGSAGLFWDTSRIKLHTRDHRPGIHENHKRILKHMHQQMAPYQKTVF